MLELCAKASTTEEPGAGKLYVGDCAAVPSNRHSYRGATYSFRTEEVDD
jgi:hypothetical protein